MIVMSLLLAGCDAGPSAVVQDGQGQAPAQKPETKKPVWAAAASDGTEEASMAVIDAPDAPAVAVDPPKMGQPLPLPLPDGARAAITTSHYGDWPLWSQSRQYSADNNAHYQYAHHGAEIGATSYGDFLARVHGFIHHPPAGTETLKRRNGDTLLYNAQDNIFAVMTKDGAPRKLYRPPEGAGYWAQQKQIEAAGGNG